VNTTWMDGQFVLSFYQACLTLLVWLLATFSCLGILTSLAMLCYECRFSSGASSLALLAHSDNHVQEKTRVAHLKSPGARQDEMNKA
jgi:hypothetical protein